MEGTVQLARGSAAQVETFTEQPDWFFDQSYTAMHSIPRQELLDLQRAALSRRFQQARKRVPMVAKLADRQGITSVDDVEDVVPLLFEHTMYKSYPLALLERGQFDKLTAWIGKLTAIDLSSVDASGCESIDSWLRLLVDQAGLELGFSSGTSGTMSFFPWSVRDSELKWRCVRIAYLQRFGEPPSRTALEEPYHLVFTTRRSQRNYMAETFTLGRDEYCHMRNQAGYSADLGWLAARIRHAAARGDTSRVQVPESLLVRRAEIEQSAAEERQREESWGEALEQLRGERVMWIAYPYDLHQLAAPRVERGERWAFSPDSSVLLVGGLKGRTLPDDWRSTVERFLDNSIRSTYGMTELSQVAMECASGRYHLPPWIIPLILDPETSELRARRGVQRGRAAYFDLLPSDHWGGFMSGDEVEVDFDGLCSCGATTYHLSPDIARLSDKRGGTDKISCAASPEAHAEAMDFLVGY